MSIQQVADLHGCHKRTVQEAVRRGEIPVVAVGAKPVYGIETRHARRWSPLPVGRPPAE